MAGVLAAPARSSPKDPIAYVIATKAFVEVVHPRGAVERATPGCPLERGDKVRVGHGGAATLLFLDGNTITVLEGTIEVSRKGPDKRGGLLARLLSPEFTKFLTRGSREEGLYSSVAPRAGERSEFLVAPVRTELITDRPAFDWRRVEKASRYRVAVAREDGAVEWSHVVDSDSMAYPSGARALARGVDYRWSVQALAGERLLKEDAGTFYVLEAGAAAAVRDTLKSIGEIVGGSETTAARVLAASYLAARGIYREALQEMEALAAADPDAPGPRFAIGNLYQAQGLNTLAHAEFARARALKLNPRQAATAKEDATQR